jgi:TrmH family RNA methyltransferase
VVVRTRNDVYQWVEVLKRNRAKRRQLGEFLVEGVAPINQALSQGWPVRAVVYDRTRALSRWAGDVLARCPDATRIELPPALLEEISDRQETSELLVVAAMREVALNALDAAAPMTVVLDRPSSPGNLGSIIRSCSAFGCGGVVVLGHAADPYDPQAVRASLGALFSVPLVVNPSSAALGDWIGGARRAAPSLQVAGADPGAAARIEEVDLARPTVLLLGNEKRGLGARLRGLCDLTFSIPMSGVVDSLNLAAAATVVLYEADRQRRAAASAAAARA